MKIIDKILGLFGIEIDRHICKFNLSGYIYQCPICANSKIIWKKGGKKNEMRKM